MPHIRPSSDALMPPCAAHRAYIVEAAPNGGLQLRGDRWMALRSALHRLFGVGKTTADAARNRASWLAMLDVIEARAGRSVRERVCHSRLALPGDDDTALTVAHRIERGSYLSSTALTGIAALFNEADAVRYANELTYARLFAPGEDEAVYAPLQAVLDALILGLNPTATSTADGNPPPLPETRAYVALQLKLGLQQEAADRLRRDPAALVRSLAECTPDAERLRRADVRARWLQEFDARLMSARLPARTGKATDSAAAIAADRERAIAALLSEWRRHELIDALECNDKAREEESARLSRLDAETRILDGADSEVAAPCSTEADARASPMNRHTALSVTMESLLAEKNRLLAELKGREISDAVRRCEHHLSMAADNGTAEHWKTRRAQLVEQWRRPDLAEQKERDRIRQQQLQIVRQTVRQEVERCTALGERLDGETLARMVAALLSRPAYVRQFLIARNLQLVYDAGHGADRAVVMARLVRACAGFPRADDSRGQLDDSDFEWLATALEGGENDVVVLDSSPMLKGAKRLFARLGRERWPVALVCDMAAARLDAYAEERRRAAAQWRGCQGSPEMQWKARVSALRDTIRTEEWTIDELAPVVFDVFKTFLHARHIAMCQFQEEQRAAEQHLAALRSLYPALSQWNAVAPTGACPITLADLASLEITGRLLNAHNFRLEARRARLIALEEQRYAARAARHVASNMVDIETTVGARTDHDLELGERQSMREMIRAKQEVERRLRDALDGTASAPGLLEPACQALEQFAKLWPRWRAGLRESAGPSGDPELASRGESLHALATRAQAAIAAIRQSYITEALHCTSLPADVARRIQAELQQVEQALEALERSLDWIQCLLPEGNGGALIVPARHTVTLMPVLPDAIPPAVRHAVRGLVMRLL